VLDATDHPDAADTAVELGLVGAVGAALTGLTDWQATDGPARRVGIVHGLLNTTAAALYALSLAERRSKNRDAGRISLGDRIRGGVRVGVPRRASGISEADRRRSRGRQRGAGELDRGA
jgi:hypothetical protein